MPRIVERGRQRALPGVIREQRETRPGGADGGDQGRVPAAAANPRNRRRTFAADDDGNAANTVAVGKGLPGSRAAVELDPQPGGVATDQQVPDLEEPGTGIGQGGTVSDVALPGKVEARGEDARDVEGVTDDRRRIAGPSLEFLHQAGQFGTGPVARVLVPARQGIVDAGAVERRQLGQGREIGHGARQGPRRGREQAAQRVARVDTQRQGRRNGFGGLGWHGTSPLHTEGRTGGDAAFAAAGIRQHEQRPLRLRVRLPPALAHRQGRLSAMVRAFAQEARRDVYRLPAQARQPQRIANAAHRQLRILTLDGAASTQQLLTETLNDVFQKRGKARTA